VFCPLLTLYIQVTDIFFTEGSVVINVKRLRMCVSLSYAGPCPYNFECMGPYTSVCKCLRSCPSVCESVGPRPSVYECFDPCPSVCEIVGPGPSVYECFDPCPSICKYVGPFISVCEYVGPGPSVCECVGPGPSVFEYMVQVHQYVSLLVPVSPEIRTSEAY